MSTDPIAGDLQADPAKILRGAGIVSRLKLVLPLLLLSVLAGCLFFAGLGSLPLLEPDEGRNAEVAREMLASGDWITPHYDALPYLDKPAVLFWLVASSFKVAGLHEWSARKRTAGLSR
jgi:4-amino-4-deoxy-L-arabinose transferase-like glycosyltransferase